MDISKTKGYMSRVKEKRGGKSSTRASKYSDMRKPRIRSETSSPKARARMLKKGVTPRKAGSVNVYRNVPTPVDATPSSPKTVSASTSGRHIPQKSSISIKAKAPKAVRTSVTPSTHKAPSSGAMKAASKIASGYASKGRKTGSTAPAKSARSAQSSSVGKYNSSVTPTKATKGKNYSSSFFGKIAKAVGKGDVDYSYKTLKEDNANHA